MEILHIKLLKYKVTWRVNFFPRCYSKQWEDKDRTHFCNELITLNTKERWDVYLERLHSTLMDLRMLDTVVCIPYNTWASVSNHFPTIWFPPWNFRSRHQFCFPSLPSESEEWLFLLPLQNTFHLNQTCENNRRILLLLDIINIVIFPFWENTLYEYTVWIHPTNWWTDCNHSVTTKLTKCK